jgi:hypothetical protein
MKRRAIAVLFAAGMTVGGVLATAGVASADPISCPGKQISVKTSAGWECQNPGGNTSNAEDTNNPNTKKWGDRP